MVAPDRQTLVKQNTLRQTRWNWQTAIIERSWRSIFDIHVNVRVSQPSLFERTSFVGPTSTFVTLQFCLLPRFLIESYRSNFFSTEFANCQRGPKSVESSAETSALNAATCLIDSHKTSVVCRTVQDTRDLYLFNSSSIYRGRVNNICDKQVQSFCQIKI